jgi:hypothetical protein
MASLAEAATIELFKEINPTPSRENVTLAIKGGVAKVVREWLEQQLGRIPTEKNVDQLLPCNWQVLPANSR